MKSSGSYPTLESTKIIVFKANVLFENDEVAEFESLHTARDACNQAGYDLDDDDIFLLDKDRYKQIWQILQD